MFKVKRWVSIFMTLLLCAAVLAACGKAETNGERGQNNAQQQNNGQQSSSNNQSQGADNETGAAEGEQSGETRSFTDWTGHTVEVPVNPQRIIFHGETTGDFMVLDTKPVGILYNSIAGTLIEDSFKQVEDIGFPFNLEKAMSLEPDLIIFGNADEAQYEEISKIAPTVTFDTFAGLEQRLMILGELLGKQEQAKTWLAEYAGKEAAMWKQIHDSGITEDETATVLTMYPGNRLFAMAVTGLSQILYSEGGLKPVPLVQQAIDNGQGFVEISFEVLPEYAGDHIFLLTPTMEDAANEMEEMKKSQVWSSLEAVKNGQVYTFGINESYSDASSREKMLGLIPEAMMK